MKYLSVDIVLRMQSTGYFPAYKGSMLRGALGTNLRRALCMTQKSSCVGCMLEQVCLFPKLFTAPVAGGPSEAASLAPPPYCIEPPQGEQRVYEAGTLFPFRLKLFSYAAEYLPYFVHAFSLMGRRGLGRGTETGAGLFQIERILLRERSIYDRQTEKLIPVSPEELSVPSFGLLSEAEAVQRVSVCFSTPLRFKQANHLAADLPFTQLIRLIVRRIRSLWLLEKAAVSLEAFPESMRLAETVQAESSLHWKDWSRYSGRQNTLMQLGGLMGCIQYTGPLRPFEELLQFAGEVHLGKQTSFGLGQCIVSPVAGE